MMDPVDADLNRHHREQERLDELSEEWQAEVDEEVERRVRLVDVRRWTRQDADAYANTAALHERDEAEDFLLRHGYRRCDIPACNCGSWHGGHANDRLYELREAFAENDYTNANGKTLLTLVRETLAERDALRAALAHGMIAFDADLDLYHLPDADLTAERAALDDETGAA